ncbi:uncharacterized protein LOC122055734 [Zingiber officinale]|nr:uncharacterized protein LOC122055734 [Zingiber officinale]
MGCAASKLEGEDLRPGPYSVQRKIMEVKRPPRRGRRLSTVSTTELLRSSDADGEHGVEKLAAVEEFPEEKGRRLWQRVAGDEQLPGSPSFRFYFAGSTDADESDDGSEIFQKENTEKHKQTVDGTTSKDSDTSQGKEKKGKKLRVLRKTPHATDCPSLVVGKAS